VMIRFVEVNVIAEKCLDIEKDFELRSRWIRIRVLICEIDEEEVRHCIWWCSWRSCCHDKDDKMIWITLNNLKLLR
jgi:hypothetical protein